jgi:hypothetical protein
LKLEIPRVLVVHAREWHLPLGYLAAFPLESDDGVDLVREALMVGDFVDPSSLAVLAGQRLVVLK